MRGVGSQRDTLVEARHGGMEIIGDGPGYVLFQYLLGLFDLYFRFLEIPVGHKFYLIVFHPVCMEVVQILLGVRDAREAQDKGKQHQIGHVEGGHGRLGQISLRVYDNVFVHGLQKTQYLFHGIAGDRHPFLHVMRARQHMHPGLMLPDDPPEQAHVGPVDVSRNIAYRELWLQIQVQIDNNRGFFRDFGDARREIDGDRCRAYSVLRAEDTADLSPFNLCGFRQCAQPADFMKRRGEVRFRDGLQKIFDGSGPHKIAYRLVRFVLAHGKDGHLRGPAEGRFDPAEAVIDPPGAHIQDDDLGLPLVDEFGAAFKPYGNTFDNGISPVSVQTPGDIFYRSGIAPYDHDTDCL